MELISGQTSQCDSLSARVTNRWVAALTVAALLTTTAAADDAHQDRHQQAIAEAEHALRDDGYFAAHRQAGDAYLRAGEPAKAVQHFEQAIRLRPESEPYLWQHGIALYFVGRYEEGQKLFEQHRRVNPHDVENAAWHFACVAKAHGWDEAKELLLPAPNDPRPPMKEILAYLKDGSDEAIKEAVEALRRSPQQHRSARFYADLYRGLVADAKGERQEAIRLMKRAAATPMTSYMADVARAYVRYLESPPAKKPS